MKKTTTCILLSMLVFVFVFAGCGQANDKDSTTQATTAAQTTQGQTAVAQNSGEPITWDTADLSWKKDTSPVTLSAFIDMSWYAVDTWGKDDISPVITKNTGITLDVTKATDASQLDVLIASNQMPDLIYTESAPMFSKLNSSDFSLSLDDLAKQYCPEFLQLLAPDEVSNNTEDDGHIYALTNTYANDEDWKDQNVLPSVGNSWLHVRKDIMEALGNPKLESFDDFYNVLKMVKEKYPKMTPMVQYVDWQSPFTVFMGLQVKDKAYVDGSGTVKIGITDPVYLEYYKYVNRLFREGLLPKETFTYNMDQFNQVVNSGNVFAVGFNCKVSDDANLKFDQSGENYEFMSLQEPLKYNGETKYKVIDSSLGWARCYVSTNCSNPARAVNFLEYLRSPEGDKLTSWGIEGTHYTLDSRGLPIRPDDFTKRTYTETGIVQWGWLTTAKINGMEYVGRIKPDGYNDNFNLTQKIKPYVDRQPALAFVNPKLGSPEFDSYAKIQEYLKAQDTAIIISNSEDTAVAEYNKTIEQLKKMGLDDVEKYMNNNYAKVITKYQE